MVAIASSSHSEAWKLGQFEKQLQFTILGSFTINSNFPFAKPQSRKVWNFRKTFEILSKNFQKFVNQSRRFFL